MRVRSGLQRLPWLWPLVLWRWPSYWGCFGDPRYQRVSLEHILRRLVETDEVARLVNAQREHMIARLNLLARRYEQFASSVCAAYRQQAQAWSFGIGIVLAFLINADGLRLFETYQADNELAQVVIAQQVADLIALGVP